MNETKINKFDKQSLSYTKEQAITEASRCLNCKNPPCAKACPVGNHIPAFIKEIKNNNIEGAYQILLDRTALPEICGVVCNHQKQCQGSCARGIKGEPVTIGALEEYVAKYIRENNFEEIIYTPNNRNVAIVGSGPAGMAAAYYLSKTGYKVTIYEKENFLGGVLTWGIPSFRLNKEIVNDFFNKLKKLNVSFKTNYELGKDISIEELSDNNDYVIIATGATLPNKMNIDGEDLPYIVQANSFLTELSKMNKEEINTCDKYGKHVLVIGGGNVAIDSARSAIRLPGVEKVSIVYRRTKNEMPVSIEELEQAVQEGVEITELTSPTKFHTDNKIECALMKLGEMDKSGRRSPIDANAEHIYLEADTVIMAVGFRNKPMFNNDSNKLKVDDKNRIIVNENCVTSLENVYAIGDSVSGPDTVVNAVKQAFIVYEDIVRNSNI